MCVTLGATTSHIHFWSMHKPLLGSLLNAMGTFFFQSNAPHVVLLVCRIFLSHFLCYGLNGIPSQKCLTGSEFPLRTRSVNQLGIIDRHRHLALWWRKISFWMVETGGEMLRELDTANSWITLFEKWMWHKTHQVVGFQMLISISCLRCRLFEEINII